LEASPLQQPTAATPLGRLPEPRAAEVVGSAVASCLLFSASLLPGAVPGPFAPLGLLSLFSSFPLILSRLRGGRVGALAATLLTTCLLGAVLSPGQGLAFLSLLAAPGLLMGEAMAGGHGLLKGGVWAFALIAVVIGVALLLAGPELAGQVSEPLEQFRSEEFLAELKAGGLSMEQVEQWSDQLGQLLSAWRVVYPAAFLIMGALLVIANVALLRVYLARRQPGWLETGDLEGLRWPFGLTVAFVVSGALVLIPALRSVAYNALLLVGFFYAVQGLAVVVFYIRRLAGPLLLRAGLVLLLLLNPWAPQVLALVGLFDTWVDFRRFAEPPGAQEG
jgi:uncharacterized protein YybS (DUF2232 family)